MDKALLLKRKVSGRTKDVELLSLEDGGPPTVVTVRGLTRDEVKECSGKKGGPRSREEANKIDPSDAENRMIHMALVDPADMTLEEVAEWMKHGPSGDSVKVMEAVQELSALAEGAPKSDVPRNGARRRR